MKITIFESINTTNNPYYIEISKVIERIKNGKSKDKIEEIRTTSNPEIKKQNKLSLPCLCFSGIFEKRANNAIKQHSGLVCIDFDHVQNLNEFKAQICKDKYTFIAFISPSGDGLKVVLKIPANIETHAKSCKAIKEYYKNDKLDSFEDVARICFESYDPEIFVNLDSEVFTELFESTEIVFKHETKTNIQDDFEIFNRLKTWIEETETYSDGGKHKFLVKFAAGLNRYGVNKHNAVSYLKNTYRKAASYVPDKDFEKIVNDVYTKYASHYNISYFEYTGISYERNTKNYTPKEFFKDFDVQNEIYEGFFDKTFIDYTLPPQPQPVYIYIRKSNMSSFKVPLFTAGNISAIAGKAKSKKTFLCSMIAAALVSNESIQNTFYPCLPQEKNNILYIDTEQSRYDVWKVNDRIVQMSGGLYQNLNMFSLRGFEPEKIVGYVEYIINRVKNIGVIFIDQVADLCKSINDEEEANRVVKKLEKISTENKIHICCVIHQNKMNDMATGWLGSQILKKSETIIKVKRNEQINRISMVEPDLMRGSDFEPFLFEINQNGFPEITTDSDLMPSLNPVF